MTSQDLLERRAERGSPRGPAHVWANAQPDTGQQTSRQGAWGFRVALAAWVLVIGVLAVSAMTSGKSAEVADIVEDETTPEESVEPIPEPILVDGMTLKRVTRPFDPDFDADDILDDLGFTRGRPHTLEADGSRPNAIVVFADPNNRFTSPILGLNLYDDGGFRPFSANATRAKVDELLADLSLVDGTWTMNDETNLVEVARFETDPFDLLKFGWQFDFVDGNDEVILQAETNVEGSQASEWLWIARQVQENSIDTTISEIEVLGHPGIHIQRSESPGDVVWAIDGFVYRMTAATIEGNTAVSRDATGEIERLRVGDRLTWIAAVNKAEERSRTETFGLLMATILGIALVASLLFFALRRSGRSAGLTLIALAATVFFGSSDWSTPLIAVGGLALAWWSYSTGRGEGTSKPVDAVA